MSSSQTEQWLERYVTQNDPLAVGMHGYLQTGDIKHIEQIPVDLEWRDCKEFHSFAVPEVGKHKAADSVLKAVAHRIVNGDNTTADLAASIFALQCIEKNNVESGVDRKLVAMCREQGLRDLDFARFWMINLGHFGGPNFHESLPYAYELDYLLSPEEHFCLPDDFIAQNAYEELLLGLTDDDALKLLQHYQHADVEKRGGGMSRRWYIGPYQAFVSRDRPDVFKQFLQSMNPEDSLGATDWRFVIGATDVFDSDCIENCKMHNDAAALIILNTLREGRHKTVVTSHCMAQPCNDSNAALLFLYESAPDLLVEKLIRCYSSEDFSNVNTDYLRKYCSVAGERWDQGGDQLFKQFTPEQLLNDETFPLKRQFRIALIQGATRAAAGRPELAAWLLAVANQFDKPNYPWDGIAKVSPIIIESELWEMLKDKLKATRDVAVTGLAQESMGVSVKKVKDLLQGKDSNAKLGAIELLSAISSAGSAGSSEATQALQSAASEKHPAKVSQALNKALEKLGAAPSLEEALEGAGKNSNPETVLAAIEKKRAPKLPRSADWLNLNSLPALLTHDGTALSEKAVATLCIEQARHKSISAAPENLPLLALINREKSGDFAVALLTQWLGSSQQATTRWGLALAGLLGDQRVLPLLTDPIQAWAEDARHKLGEYAAQAVALVPVEESLMILESLSNRSRSRFRNSGKASRAALERAAELQNVSMDELADRIVPTLDFDENYQRPLPGTAVVAVLQPDFKLRFFNPENDTETTSPPKSLPEEAVSEISTVRKLIRTLVKGQTTRLEQTLVTQRGWPTRQWQALFEVHPFLQSYASRLVWASFDSNGELKQLFRRYPNGLLADANGDLVEMDESDVVIRMAHPLLLEEQVRQTWRQHLSRMKVKPPFPQLERPFERLDKSHHNRKSIDITDKHEMPSGTLRSRAEKLGWARVVGESGRITSFYKLFPGESISAYLLIDFMVVGQVPTDNATLGAAHFVKSESAAAGNYYKDEPENSEARGVLPFGQVAPVVYSETVTDLQTIIGKS